MSDGNNEEAVRRHREADDASANRTEASSRPIPIEKAKLANARQARQFADWPFVREWRCSWRFRSVAATAASVFSKQLLMSMKANASREPKRLVVSLERI